VFRAGRNFYRYKVVLWTIGQVGAILGAVSALLVLRGLEDQITRPIPIAIIRLGEIVGWITLVAQIPFTFAMLRLDYDMRWYIVTDRSLRIREGVARVVEKTMTFRNIQQISIRQGPIQRALGISDVEVRTAGGGASSPKEGKNHGAGEEMHVASFRGVDNAAEIRDVIAERIRLYRDSGLGDPDEPQDPAAATDALAAARELLEEARGLRGAVER
jgi:uncharacterized membrane protein YdbT with pleckstrin-like domain